MTEEEEMLRFAAEIQRMDVELGFVHAKMRPFEVYSLIASLQLAWRHPDLSQQQKTIIEAFAVGFEEAFEDYPILWDSLQRGWDVEQDRQRGNG